ncbi:HAMP domain-containing protein [Proteiniclasticum sp. BAD-10]|uniref:histidine kinase n=2 Tax=Proteiniclasticum sediminis TaxID=2804028 RepID=A0A941CLJ2_9CLOT|nr:HAMP domain-containing protein [Proteiniclasticum sediminis]
MMYKITRKLIFFITSLLLVFSLIMAFLFSLLFTRHTMDFHKNDMERRVVAIAENFSQFMESGTVTPSMGMGMGMKGRMGGFMPYLNVIDDIAMSDVWIVDENEQLVIRGQGMSFNYKDLPDTAEEVLQKVFQGEIAFSESFSGVLGASTLTVGAPVKDSTGKIIAAVLLHAPIEGMESVTANGLNILALSTIIALILAFGLAILFSLKFVKPLQKMNQTASELIEGNYLAKTGVQQKDEIGDLATTLDVLSQRLQEASLESEKLEQSRRDFISNISHELRTPVTVLRGSLEALNDKVVSDPEKVAVYHQQMLAESIFLQRLVDDLLSLTKLQNPDFKMDMQKLNFTEVLQDVTRSMRTVAEKKQVRIQLENPFDTLPMTGDYGRLRQMVMIVVDNAVKFSPESGEVKLLVNCTKGTCQLDVTDEGKGIAPEQMAHLFERFNRNSDESNRSGTGLGLAIANEIAHRHGLSLSANSEPGKATTFTFRFKLEKSGISF